ncbi:helicase-related protein [Streptomyces sp. NPDC059168]|uniref:helicase-related protein n=1 Tax=Streptomyces sp. NPDC059168 TaxID=3346753 RepID=UPI003694454A
MNRTRPTRTYSGYGGSTATRRSSGNGNRQPARSEFTLPKTVTPALPAVGSFAGLAMPTPLLATLGREGVTVPFPIQAATLPNSLAGRDVLGRGRTGSGKTLAFGLAVLARTAGRRAEPHRPLALVLVPTRELAQQVTDALAPYARSVRLRLATVVGGVSVGSGVHAAALHGGRSQPQRARPLAQFKDGHVTVLVATNVAARGIHVDSLDLVVNVDPPSDHKDYLHRGGRTARAVESGSVVTLVTPGQRRGITRLMVSAGLTPHVTPVRSGEAELSRITGAKAPSGVPVVITGPVVERRRRTSSPSWDSRRTGRHRPVGAGMPRRAQRQPGDSPPGRPGAAPGTAAASH